MKIAYPIRTCDSVFNFWNSTRIVDCDKATIVTTCVNSLLNSIAAFDHEPVISFHDDNSSEQTLDTIQELCHQYNLKYELFHTESKHNFISQYEWLVDQEFDYVYCVEDDYLHKTNAIHDMAEMIQFLNYIVPKDYAIYPFNNPHRYANFQSLYPSYIVKGPNQYWRSLFHSTHTFFISRKCFTDNIHIMREQSYNWHVNGAVEDSTINKVWHEQNTMLFCPMHSLAYHIADESQKDNFTDWRLLWNENNVSSKHI
jgi:hypothetical protein